MSRQFRHRVMAIVLGGLLLGAPLLTNGTASAGQVEGGGRQVVFGGGGMLDFSCRSRPDVESMTVPAESTITVVNRTGRSARLLLGGTEQGALADDGSTQVVFRHGTTAVMLDPVCALGDEATPILVTAAPTTPAVPGPIPAPVITTPSAGPPSGSNSSPASTGTSLPGSASSPPTGRPQRPSTDASKDGAIRGGGSRPGPGPARATTTAAQAMPLGGRSVRAKTRTSGGTTGAAAPVLAGLPPGQNREPSGVPSLDLAPATTTAPAAPAVPTTQVAAAEPVAAMEPMAPERPIGLLALVASICVIGVGVGAIRSFAAQRAYRSTIA